MFKAVTNGIKGIVDTLDHTISPLVLDMDGHGAELTSLHDSHATLLGNDGQIHRVSWFGAGSAVLAYDANHNGLVDNLTELALTQFKLGATSDLEGLSALDSNGNGFFDALDEKFGSFVVWRDANGDGVNDPGEVVSLVQAGITAIALTRNGEIQVRGGTLVQNTTYFVSADGAHHEVLDVAIVAAHSSLMNAAA